MLFFLNFLNCGSSFIPRGIFYLFFLPRQHITKWELAYKKKASSAYLRGGGEWSCYIMLPILFISFYILLHDNESSCLVHLDVTVELAGIAFFFLLLSSLFPSSRSQAKKPSRSPKQLPASTTQIYQYKNLRLHRWIPPFQVTKPYSSYHLRIYTPDKFSILVTFRKPPKDATTLNIQDGQKVFTCPINVPVASCSKWARDRLIYERLSHIGER